MRGNNPLSDENELERALERAAADPAYRPRFYQELLGATVFVLGESEPSSTGRTTLPLGSKVRIQSETSADGAAFIPFFSSLDKLRAFIRAERKFLSLPAKSLFELTRGERLVLNPGASWGKELLAAEIDVLLSSGGPLPERRIVASKSQVLLGQPANYPTAMVASLSRLFTENRLVKAGYLALMQDAALDEHPHLLIGIEADGDFDAISRDAGIVVSALASKDETVDIIRVMPGEDGVSRYFIESTTPFFQRDRLRH